MTDARQVLLPWQQTVWDGVQQVLEAGRLPHALLLTGPSGLGKQHFARLLAQALNCRTPQRGGLPCGDCGDCRQAAGDVHPDIGILEPEAPGKPLTVEPLRDLIARAVLTPEAGRRRVSVLVPADALNVAAANALLKTLEEPTPGSLFLLVTSRPAALPATIRSRCQHLRFPPPSAAQLHQWLDGHDCRDAIAALLPLVGNAPLRAETLVAEGADVQPHRMGQDLAAIGLGRRSALAVAADWAQTDPDWFLTLLWFWTVDLLRLKQCAEPPLMSLPGAGDVLSPLLERLDLQSVHHLLARIQEFRRELRHNLNPLLMMERLLVDWQRLGVRR